MGNFNAYSVHLQSYITNKISQTLKPLELTIQGAVQESTGEIKFPNPILINGRVGDTFYRYDFGYEQLAIVANNPREQLVRQQAMTLTGDK